MAMLPQVRASGGLPALAAGVSALLLMLPAGSWPAHAQQPVCAPAAGTKPGAVGPKSKQEVGFYCSDNCNKDQAAFDTCEKAWSTVFAALSGTAGGDAAAEEAGVCKVKSAVGKFYTTVPVFNAIRDNLTVASAGLTNPANRQDGPYSEKNFGPTGNPGAQQANRRGMSEYLDRIKSEFETNIALYATLSKPECFECAAVEKWAVLKGAANLVSYSYEYSEGGQGLRVGLGKRHELSATTDDDIKDLPKATDRKRDIATRFVITPSAARPGRKDTIALDDVTDQWVMALSPTLIADLKREVCELVNRTGASVYANGSLYYEHARRVQHIVNRAFTKPTEDGRRKTAFEAAFDSTATLSAGRKMRDVAKKLDAKQCAEAGMELTEYSNYQGEWNIPDWCAKSGTAP
jgi:hypothetical protein